MISEELLSEVIDEEVTRVDNVSHGCLNYIIKFDDDTLELDIDIHRLAHKCKMWALKQDYILKSRVFYLNGASSCEVDKPVKEVAYEEAKSEPEAIFRACGWILNSETENAL